jgi:hypothetical protein
MGVGIGGDQIKDGGLEEADLNDAVKNKLIPSPEGVTDGWVLTKDEASPGKRRWAAGGAGGSGSENTGVAGRWDTTETDYYVVGAVPFDKANFSGKTIKFVAVAAQLGSVTGYVQLYNLTDGESTAVLEITGGAPTRYESSSLTLPTGTKVYEVRIKSGSSSQSLILYGAQLEMR